MDLHVAAESHNAVLRGGASHVHLAQAADDGLVERHLFPQVGLVHIDEQHLDGRCHSGTGVLRPAQRLYKLGSTSKVSNSVESTSPTTTVARGRWTSEPMPVARAAGTIPSNATMTIISTGRNCAIDP